MGRAFSPRSVCDAILGRCPRLVWGAPLALRHTRFTRFMHARHPRHAWRGRRGRRGRHAWRGRRGRASTPRRFSTRCLTWRRMISMRASCMRDGAWTTRSSRHEQGQRPASIPAWGNAPGFVMGNDRGLKARSMHGYGRDGSGFQPSLCLRCGSLGVAQGWYGARRWRFDVRCRALIEHEADTDLRRLRTSTADSYCG